MEYPFFVIKDTSSLCDDMVCPFPMKIDKPLFRLSAELNQDHYLNDDIIAKTEITGDGSCAIYSALFPSKTEILNKPGFNGDLNNLATLVNPELELAARNYIASCILSSMMNIPIRTAIIDFQKCLRYFANINNETKPTISFSSHEKVDIFLRFKLFIEDDLDVLEKNDFTFLINNDCLENNGIIF
jgi:hypothetical protein